MRAAVVLYLASALLWAQPANVGGDACGYRWYTHLAGVNDSTPTYNWISPGDLTNVQYLTGLGDDNFGGPISLPFSFVYYWNSYTKVYVGSNGYITFGRGHNVSSTGNPYFPAFPNTAAPNEWIAPYLADLTFVDSAGNPVPDAKLYYGSTTDGRFVITWDSVPYWNADASGDWSGRNSFQLILNPADSSITFQYKEITAGYHSSYANGNFNVVGMENITGQSGLNIATAWSVPFSGYAIKIWHPGTFTCSSTDVAADWSLTPQGEAIFVLKNGTPPTLTAGVRNTGNQSISNQVRSVLRIQGPGGATTAIYRDTVFLNPPFAVGDVLIATYTKPFSSNQNTPTSLQTGSYRALHIVNIVGVGDGYAGNNQYLTELVIADTLTSGPNEGKYLLRYDDGAWDPQNDDLGGIGFAHGMTFVAPEDIVVEAISVDMFYRDDLTNTYPVALWVYAYDPVSGAVGAQVDSVGLDPTTDFVNGDSLDRFQGQGGETYTLRRYSVPLTSLIPLASGQGLAVGFRTLHPPNATNISNYVVSDMSPPISRRALEGIAGVWASARNLEEEDYAIGLIARRNTSTAVPSSMPPVWGFTVFPNPAREAPFVRVELPAPGPVTFRLVDLTGKVLWQESREIPSTSYKLRLPAGLPSGTYLLGLTYQGFTKGQRLVIE